MKPSPSLQASLLLLLVLSACGESSAPGQSDSSTGRLAPLESENTITAGSVDFSKLAAACGEQMPNEALSCTIPQAADGLEMPCNPHLAQSAWSGSHRNNYAQASSPLPGITGKPEDMNISHIDANGPSIVLNFSDADVKGRRAVWSSTVGMSSTWSNRDVSWPNGIPAMSASTNQIFGIGSRTVNGVDMWTLESVDFSTGKTLFSIPSSPYPSDNSFYAATTIGPGASVWTGTLYGVTRFDSCDPATGKLCGQRALNPVVHLPRQAITSR